MSPPLTSTENLVQSYFNHLRAIVEAYRSKGHITDARSLETCLNDLVSDKDLMNADLENQALKHFKSNKVVMQDVCIMLNFVHFLYPDIYYNSREFTKHKQVTILGLQKNWKKYGDLFSQIKYHKFSRTWGSSVASSTDFFQLTSPDERANFFHQCDPNIVKVISYETNDANLLGSFYITVINFKKGYDFQFAYCVTAPHVIQCFTKEEVYPKQTATQIEGPPVTTPETSKDANPQSDAQQAPQERISEEISDFRNSVAVEPSSDTLGLPQSTDHEMISETPSNTNSNGDVFDPLQNDYEYTENFFNVTNTNNMFQMDDEFSLF